MEVVIIVVDMLDDFWLLLLTAMVDDDDEVMNLRLLMVVQALSETGKEDALFLAGTHVEISHSRSFFFAPQPAIHPSSPLAHMDETIVSPLFSHTRTHSHKAVHVVSFTAVLGMRASVFEATCVYKQRY